MSLNLDENSTRRSILTLLKKRGGLSIDALSKEISLTQMGIRQHLLCLQKKGLVTYIAKKHGIGRPGFVYMLTESAVHLFPKSYDSLAVDILKDIRRNEGPEKIHKILAWRKERLFKKRRETLAGTQGIGDTLYGLKDILESEGYLIDISRDNGTHYLKTFNCPINKIALEFNEFCLYELQLYRELLNRDVIMEQSIQQGNNSCIFAIPNA